MKIIQVMPEFGLAGAETMCENLSYELIKLGHQVVIISLYNYHSPITDRLEKNGVKVLYLDKKPGLDISVINRLRAVFKAERPDVIHTHRYVMQYTIPASFGLKIRKKIHTIHNIAIKENTYVARKLNCLFYHFVHVVPVALSDEIKKTIIQEYHVSESRVPVVCNGIDLSKCIPKENYKLNNPAIVLHIGRFSNQKNHIGLINAFEIIHKEFHNCVLELIGEGELIDSIRQVVVEKGLSDWVRFEGLTTDVYTYLNKADLFVLPSLFEGMPMTLIEAMGTGLPIVATNVGGIPNMLIDNSSAKLVDVDPDEIAKACVTFLQDEMIRNNYGREAVKQSMTFSSRKMAEEYMKLYEH